MLEAIKTRLPRLLVLLVQQGLNARELETSTLWSVLEEPEEQLQEVARVPIVLLELLVLEAQLLPRLVLLATIRLQILRAVYLVLQTFNAQIMPSLLSLVLLENSP